MFISLESRSHVHAPRILIIDDDDAFGRSAARLLARMGLGASFHRGPFGTLNAVRQSGCDVVLLDIDMPSLDGASLARMLRTTFGDRVRVVLCSNMEGAFLQRVADELRLFGAVPKVAFEEERVDVILAGLGVRGRGGGGESPPRR